MTAPADLDVDDRALQGEDDMFDLGEGEKEMNRRDIGKKDLGDVIRDEAAADDEESEAESSESEMEFEDSEEEREYRTQALEGELDELYDQYKDRMSERDAKWKVKQARMKDKNYDAWHGIQGENSDADSDEEQAKRMVRVPRRGDAEEGEDEGEESEEGGWEQFAARKAAIGEEDDSSESEGEADDKPRVKKARSAPTTQAKPAGKPAPAPRSLVTSLVDREQRAQMSRQAQLWFDQSVFKGVGDLAALDVEEEEEVEEDEEEEEDESMDGDDESDEVDAEGDVEMDAPSLSDADDDTVSFPSWV
jgi:AdoMet-dependent rRNA methyltransferase SPB1